MLAMVQHLEQYTRHHEDDQALLPSCAIRMLERETKKRKSSFRAWKRRQEDAGELLSFLFDGLSEEMEKHAKRVTDIVPGTPIQVSFLLFQPDMKILLS